MMEKAFVDGLTADGKRKKAPKRGAEQEWIVNNGHLRITGLAM